MIPFAVNSECFVNKTMLCDSFAVNSECFVNKTMLCDSFAVNSECFVNNNVVYSTELNYIYSETCLKQTGNKTESCLNQALNEVPMQKIFVNLTCINQTPTNSRLISWSQGGYV